jgi:hypothetical protein
LTDFGEVLRKKHAAADALLGAPAAKGGPRLDKFNSLNQLVMPLSPGAAKDRPIGPATGVLVMEKKSNAQWAMIQLSPPLHRHYRFSLRKAPATQ